jgi:hypothetical protein
MNGNQEPFHSLIEQLLQHMHISLPPQKRNEVYSLKFDGRTQVHFFCTEPGMLDIVADAGILANKRADDVLLRLLALNRFDARGAPLSLSVAPRGGKVSLWMRRGLAELDTDKVVCLLERMLNGVTAAQKLLMPAGGSDKDASPRLATASFLRMRGKFSGA